MKFGRFMPAYYFQLCVKTAESKDRQVPFLVLRTSVNSYFFEKRFALS